MKRILTKVKAYDHFGSRRFLSDSDRGKEYYMYWTGEIIGEDDIYLSILSEVSMIKKGNGEIYENNTYIHKVVKSTIIKRVDVEFVWDVEVEE